MLIVTLTWILFSLFGMLPFYIGGYIDNVTDAFFETMSGFTTTGSTILTNIETLLKVSYSGGVLHSGREVSVWSYSPWL